VKPKIRYQKLDLKRTPELEQFCMLVGSFIEYWGFKAIQGRIWALLYLSRQPLSSRQLAQLVRSSPALVSQSLQVLLDYGLVLSVDKAPNGMLQFEANPNVHEAIGRVLGMREAKLMGELSVAIDQVGRMRPDLTARPGSSYPLALERAEQVKQWIELAKGFLGLFQLSLASQDNPFSDPERFIKEVNAGA
jgi:DNA-binding transcriptional regulator GbsR (MarR family)